MLIIHAQTWQAHKLLSSCAEFSFEGMQASDKPTVALTADSPASQFGPIITPESCQLPNKPCNVSSEVISEAGPASYVTQSTDQIVPFIRHDSPDWCSKAVHVAQPPVDAQADGQTAASSGSVTAIDNCHVSLPHKCRFKTLEKLSRSLPQLQDDASHVEQLIRLHAAADTAQWGQGAQLGGAANPIRSASAVPISGEVIGKLQNSHADQQQQQLQYQHQQQQHHQQQSITHNYLVHNESLLPDISAKMRSNIPVVSHPRLYSASVLHAMPAPPQPVHVPHGQTSRSCPSSEPMVVREASSSTESAAKRVHTCNFLPPTDAPGIYQSSAGSSPSCQPDAVNLPVAPKVPIPGRGSKLSRVPRSTAKGWTAFTSFGLYAREGVRALNQHAAPAHIEKLVGVMWSRLSAEEKQGWVAHARCSRGGASQSSKVTRKQPAKRPADVCGGDGDDNDMLRKGQALNSMQFMHHSPRSPRSQRLNALQLDYQAINRVSSPAATDDDSTFLTWQHRTARPAPASNLRSTSGGIAAVVDDLQLEVNTIETLASMQAAASAQTRSD